MTMTSATICNDAPSITPGHTPALEEMGAFLAEYSSWIFSSGSTCIRLEKNVRRIAAVFGMSVELSIFPRHIHLTVSSDGGRHVFTSIAAILDRPVSFAINASLSRLSWDVADHKVGFSQACAEFRRIIATSGTDKWVVLLLVSLANASFCRLFGGDSVAMAVVFLSTMAGYLVKQMLSEHHVDFRLTVVICSFISSVLAAADGLFGLGSTPALSIGTSVLYLVPGIPYLNSFCDMLDRQYICAFGRLMNALVITACLSVGLCFGMLMMDVGMF